MQLATQGGKAVSGTVHEHPMAYAGKYMCMCDSTALLLNSI